MYDILKGIRVVEAAEWVFGPTAGAILADWGADVIKIEHPRRGDALRGLMNRLTGANGVSPTERPLLELSNRGKRNIAIDISTPQGREALDRLIDGADVFLTNFLPDAQVKLGITPAELQRRNPRLVCANGSAWGSKGPRAGRPGFDLAQSWAAGGIAYQMTNPNDPEPANMPSSVGDLTGALALAGGVAAALLKRERTGVAPNVEVSLYNVGMWFTAQWITAAGVGAAPPPGTRRKDMPNPLVGSYRTKDGRWLWLVFTQPDRWWPDLCGRIGRPDLLADPKFESIVARNANRDELISILDEVFAERTLDEWCSTLDGMEGAWAPVASPSEIAVDPQVEANGYFPTARGDNGEIRVVSAPIQFGGVPVGDLHTMSEFGADTESVLLELGYDWDDITSMKDAGASL